MNDRKIKQTTIELCERCEKYRKLHGVIDTRNLCLKCRDEADKIPAVTHDGRMDISKEN